MNFNGVETKWALILLGVAFILCNGLIGFLAYAEKSIPDILVATTTGILGLFGGILIPNGKQAPAAPDPDVRDVKGRHEA